MNIAAFFNQILPILQNILIFAALVGGVLAFFAQKRTGIVKIQSDTIEAMQKRIDALENENAQQQKKIDRQEFELKAMRDALKDEGIFITVDGERVTIKDSREPDTTRHIIRKSAKRTQSAPKKAEPTP